MKEQREKWVIVFYCYKWLLYLIWNAIIAIYFKFYKFYICKKKLMLFLDTLYLCYKYENKICHLSVLLNPYISLTTV